MSAVNLIVDTTNTSLPLMIRSGPGVSYSVIGSFQPLTTGLKVSQEENGWYYFTDYNGWSSGNWIKIVQNLDSDTSINTPNSDEVVISEEEAAKQEALAKEEALNVQIQKYLSYSSDITEVTDVDSLLTSTLEGIYGIPYQFMSSVDMKLDGTQFGGLYADKIIARMPLLLLSPGKVNFMRDYKNKDAAAQALQKLIESSTPTDLNELVDSHGRYYTFDFNYVDYYKYVNAMCVSGAYFLGLQDTKVKLGGKWVALKDADWGEAGQDAFKSILSSREYVAFYIDNASQIDETFSNSTTESQLASKVNSTSDVGREINFLVGSVTGDDLINNYGSQELIDSAMNTIKEISDKYLNGNQLFEDIAGNFATVACGGKLIFPEIWSDSDYSKSYNINIKLRTPDGDKLSWFMNIYVPLAHLICMTAPQQSSESGPNGYITPFLVRGFYKGLFNCDMGIITDLSITKGKDKAWTLDGLPTEVDVSLTLKDLYNMFSLTSIDNPGSFVNNISLISYIANSCGINVNEPDFTRMLDVYVMLQGNRLKHVIPNSWYYIQQSVSNRMMTTSSKLTNLLGGLDNIPGL